jgi:hypothetical protein
VCQHNDVVSTTPVKQKLNTKLQKKYSQSNQQAPFHSVLTTTKEKKSHRRNLAGKF